MMMESLPSEILEKIFREKILSHVDLSHLCRTCRRFQEVADTNDNWMIKFQLLYPKLFKHLPPTKVDKLSWRQELKKRLKIKKVVRIEIEKMSEKNFTKTELSKSDFSMFDDILVQHNHDRSHVHIYITDELSVILNTGSENANLTEKYYARKSLQHVKHAILRPEVSLWQEMEEEGVLDYETVLVMVAAWSQPEADISVTSMTSELDSLASRVLAHLHTVQPKHRIFKAVRLEQEAREEADVNWGQIPTLEKVQSENLWNSQESKEILAATNHILYTVDGFAGNKEDYYNPDNSFINKVLDTKQGIPITLSLLYTCVVARLGVVCLPINFPGHFMLKWLEHPEQAEDRLRFTFIDAFAQGKQMTEHEARGLVPHLVVQDENYLVAGPMAVAQRMLRNLISIGSSRNNSYLRDPSYGLLRNSLELMLILTSSDTMQYGFMLSRVYLQLNINHEDVMSMLQDYRDIPGIGEQVDYLMNTCQIQIDDKFVEEEKPPPKKRGVRASFPHGVVRYNIGQVCRHKKYNYVCVVHGWDVKCMASKGWISQMGVDKLPNNDKQPFYNVLVSDGSNRYAAQENLEPLDHPEIVTHPQVGKYFSQFDPGSGYVGNKQSREAYPDDRETTWED